MNLRMLALGGALVLSVSPAVATPLSHANVVSTAAAGPGVQFVHHKPGHHGGPPWARRNQERDDWRYSRGREYWRYARERDDWRYTRAPERVPICRTTYRTEFDPFEGDYVSRPVQICRERYGY